MKNIITLVVALLLILGLSAGTVMAWEVAYLRITGTLLPAEQKGRGSLHNILDVNINGKMQVFRWSKVKNLNGSGNGRTILRHVVPARVSFVGAEDLIHYLQKPEMVGRPCTITGFLYPASRVLFITAVDVVKNTPTN